MKVVISYPPLSREKGHPTLGQNRQFQYFKEPTYIYPVVPAQAATLLKQAGHEVVWNDCMSEERLSQGYFFDFIKKEKPDLVAFETKTPVIKQHWRIINQIKQELLPGAAPLTVLFGDHVTALPEESFQNSKVDFILSGGDYDFLLLNLCNNLRITLRQAQDASAGKNGAGRSEGYELQVTQLEPGIYYRQGGEVKSTGEFKLNHDLDSLPFIDRDLTRWGLYAYRNGNYKRVPGTYIMSGRDCWWGRCSFCSWAYFYPGFRYRSPGNVLEEIRVLIEKYGVKEIMDDSGTLPVGDWLREFCNGMISRGFSSKIYLDCNMRFGALSREDLSLMKRANFRLLLFGLESANQGTLDRINKNVTVQRVIEDCKLAARAGLFPHITIMFGYPWESYEDALKTFKLGRWLLKKGYAYTMQATLVVPYPGTALFEECRKDGVLLTMDWDDYDMKQAVMKTPIPEEKIMGLVRQMYAVSFNPEFVARKLFSLRDLDDLKYSFRAAKKVMGHIFDFRQAKACH